MKKILFLIFVAFLTLSNAQTQPVDGPGKKPKMVSLKTGEPLAIPYDAGTVRYLATADDTNGQWSLVELMEKPGYKTRLHRHIYTDEAYYVLEGVLTAQVGDKRYDLPAGSYILIPHGTPHAQGNLGKVPVRVLLTVTPSGFEESFRDRAELIKTAKPDDPDFRKKREEMMVKKKYDREFLADWNPK
jgi:quercetin dioxygenase-like cupin family protein